MLGKNKRLSGPPSSTLSQIPHGRRRQGWPRGPGRTGSHCCLHSHSLPSIWKSLIKNAMTVKKKKKEYNYFLDLQSGHHRVSWLSSILSPLSSLAGVTPLFSLPSFLKAKFTFKHSDSFPGQLWHTIQGPVLKIFTKLSLQCHHRIWKLGISMTTRLLFKLTFLFLFPTASKQFNST